MERSKAEAVIEAILFTMGDSVEISRLAEVIEEDVKTTKSILKDMAARYEEENRGIGLTQFDNSVQLCTKSDMYEYLIKIAKTPRKMTLTDTVLETLSIIAYKQPVTRLEIERVRGVSCDHAINGTVPSLLWCEEPGGIAGTEPGAGGGIQTAGGAGSTAHIKHIIE